VVRSLSWESIAKLAEVPGTYESKDGGAYPYTTSKGVRPVEEWWLALYHHSAKGNQRLQSFGLEPE
jgi:hypothetical protein